MGTPIPSGLKRGTLDLIRRPSRLALGAALLGISVVQAASQTAAAPPDVNPTALTLVDFRERVDKYMALHRQVENGPARLEETDDPAKIRKAQVLLAEKLRAARKDARPGDIFTPQIRALFRRLMSPELQGAKGRETKSEIEEDAPKAVTLRVNAAYPEGAALPTVPANVLAKLPELPEDLEYRLINRHLILRDVDANLIVDFIPNAIR